jgi:hypothetical protein
MVTRGRNPKKMCKATKLYPKRPLHLQFTVVRSVSYLISKSRYSKQSHLATIIELTETNNVCSHEWVRPIYG